MATVRYAHITGKRTRYTVAYTVTKNDDRLLVDYGIAQCNRKDVFTRATGRAIAQARLLKGSHSVRFGQLTANDSKDVSVLNLIREQFESARRAELSQ